MGRRWREALALSLLVAAGAGCGDGTRHARDGRGAALASGGGSVPAGGSCVDGTGCVEGARAVDETALGGGSCTCRPSCDPDQPACPSADQLCVALRDPVTADPLPGAGACVPEPRASGGELCAPEACLPGLLCVGGSANTARCRPSCDASPSSCASAEPCRDVIGDGGAPVGRACVPLNGPIGAGGDCGRDGCATGSICVNADGLAPRCRVTCDPAAAGACAAPQRCLEITDGADQPLGSACVPPSP